MHSVANPEYWNGQLQHFRVALRSIRVIHRTWATGQHNAHRLLGANFLDRSCTRQDRRENLLLADPPGNQLGVLAAEIQDNNAAFRAHRSPVVFLQSCRAFWRHSGPRSRSLYFKTMFTNLPGTTIVFTICLPATRTEILGSFFARSSVSSFVNRSSTSIFPRSRPLIWMITSNRSSRVKSSRYAGQLSFVRPDEFPNICQSSSAICGVIGEIINARTASARFKINGEIG